MVALIGEDIISGQIRMTMGIEELTETEVQCLMLILVKPELDNAIVVSDFEMVMENFGIGENADPNVQITENP